MTELFPKHSEFYSYITSLYSCNNCKIHVFIILNIIASNSIPRYTFKPLTVRNLTPHSLFFTVEILFNDILIVSYTMFNLGGVTFWHM